MRKLVGWSGRVFNLLTYLRQQISFKALVYWADWVSSHNGHFDFLITAAAPSVFVKTKDFWGRVMMFIFSFHTSAPTVRQVLKSRTSKKLSFEPQHFQSLAQLAGFWVGLNPYLRSNSKTPQKNKQRSSVRKDCSEKLYLPNVSMLGYAVSFDQYRALKVP